MKKKILALFVFAILSISLALSANADRHHDEGRFDVGRGPNHVGRDFHEGWHHDGHPHDRYEYLYHPHSHFYIDYEYKGYRNCDPYYYCPPTPPYNCPPEVPYSCRHNNGNIHFGVIF